MGKTGSRQARQAYYYMSPPITVMLLYLSMGGLMWNLTYLSPFCHMCLECTLGKLANREKMLFIGLE